MTRALSESQDKHALELLQAWRKSGQTILNQGVAYSNFREFDQKRTAAIPEIRTLLGGFISKHIGLEEFKERNSRLSIKHNYWGFTGFSGQMLLNQLSNWSGASGAMTDLLGECLQVPANKGDAKSRIHRCIERMPALVPEEKPLRRGSLPFFLSYFWQILNPGAIPVYYHNSQKTLQQLNLLEPQEDLGEALVAFWDVHDHLARLYASAMIPSQDNPYWFVEHVLWNAGQAVSHRQAVETGKGKASGPVNGKPSEDSGYMGFIPPRLRDLSQLGHGVGDSMGFEKRVGLVFKMLGFRVDQKGQGTGRNPDGIAYCRENNYAILFDAKAHSDGYSIGGDDRSAIEYILSHERKLREDGYSSLFFVFVAGGFRGDPKAGITRIRKETSVKSVALLTTDDLLKLLARKIEDPRVFDLEAFEGLLLDSGEISADSLEAFLEA